MKKELKYEGFLKIHTVEDVNKKGTPIVRDVMSRSTGDKSDDVVSGLLYDLEKKLFYLVSQYRVGTLPEDRYLIEAMAGTIDIGEEPIESFKREAMEEVGFECSIISDYGCFYTSPGGTTERVYLFMGYGSRISNGGGLDTENEDIEIMEYTLDEIKSLDIKDLKTKYLIDSIKIK